MLLAKLNVHGLTAALVACDVKGRWRNAVEACGLATLARVEAGSKKMDLNTDFGAILCYFRLLRVMISRFFFLKSCLIEVMMGLGPEVV